MILVCEDIVLRRKVYDRLVEWKGRKHNCLLIKGQHNVGKTFIVRQFADDFYDSMVEVDFGSNSNAHLAFEADLNVDTVISRLSILLDRNDITPGRTLIFLDEIQDCPRARSSLKAFSEDGRYDVIACGSLIGVMDSGIYRVKTGDDIPPLLPMGYEEHITMYGLDFEEFLWALGYDDRMIDGIRKHISEKEPFGEGMADNLMSKFREFMTVGGMPKCVEDYLVRRNPRDADMSMKAILDTVVSDINRYNSDRERTKTRACFDSIPHQLAEKNKRFTLSRIGGDGRRSHACMDRYLGNLFWIRYSGVGNFCYALSQPSLPLVGNVVPDVFKIYMSDTGILTYVYGNVARMAIHGKDYGYNQGALTENIVAECLKKSGFEPRYYRKTNGRGQMELDFVLELGCDLAVIEVKSGRSRAAPSLSKVCDFFDVDRRIMLEDGDIRIEDGIEHYPLFCAAFIEEMMDEKYKGRLLGDEPWIPEQDDSVLEGLRIRPSGTL